MTSLSLGLILMSALAHSTWNFLLKQSGDQEVFVWCLLVSASVLLAPLGAVLFWLHPFAVTGWWFVLATIVLHILYFVLLGRGYALADLSLVYPIARGIGPMLVPILAVLILGETIAPLAIFGIAAIVTGIFTVSWSGQFHRLLREPLSILRNPGTRYAALTGLTIATYAIVDKTGQPRPALPLHVPDDSGVGVGPLPVHIEQVGEGSHRPGVALEPAAHPGGRSPDFLGLRVGAYRLLPLPSQLRRSGAGGRHRHWCLDGGVHSQRALWNGPNHRLQRHRRGTAPDRTFSLAGVLYNGRGPKEADPSAGPGDQVSCQFKPTRRY